MHLLKRNNPFCPKEKMLYSFLPFSFSSTTPKIGEVALSFYFIRHSVKGSLLYPFQTSMAAAGVDPMLETFF